MIVNYFRYLGHILTKINDNGTEVVGNLRKSRQIWEQQLSILGREVEYMWTLGSFYLVAVLAILIFGS